MFKRWYCQGDIIWTVNNCSGREVKDWKHRCFGNKIIMINWARYFWDEFIMCGMLNAFGWFTAGAAESELDSPSAINGDEWGASEGAEKSCLKEGLSVYFLLAVIFIFNESLFHKLWMYRCYQSHREQVPGEVVQFNSNSMEIKTEDQLSFL